MKSNATSYGVVLSACLLVVLGDLRNLISPAGYWALWGIVVLVGFVSAPERLNFRVSRELSVYLLGFFVLIIGFLMSSIANLDVQTFYQGLKLVCIGVVFVCVYTHSQRLQQQDYYSLGAVAISVGFFFFCLAKFYIRDWYVELGDGRQGSQFAYPGVLWKTCAFFAGFVIVGTLFDSRSKVLSFLFLMAAAYVLVMDSSRTGFVIFSIEVLLILLLSIHLKPKITFFLFLLCVTVFTGVLMLYSAGYDLLNFKDSPLVVERLEAGDPVRAQMFADGLMFFDKCIPFGCGFGVTTTEVDGAPMVVHNAFLSSGGDLGVFGFLGLLIIVLSPLLIFSIRLWRYAAYEGKARHILIYAVAAFGGSLGFSLLLMLHPFSTELSEWGIWIILTSALSTLSHRLIVSDPVQVAEGGI